ncbi:hypothetical protein [Allorhizobium ampelinum]|uniref:hypothetical protein n=1 Tax=Allorhizobium ampelinum TaxID=3025782 RepID=UPI001F3AAF8B|nr:hypothetical protein [Allorhizobium ampelinum]
MKARTPLFSKSTKLQTATMAWSSQNARGDCRWDAENGSCPMGWTDDVYQSRSTRCGFFHACFSLVLKKLGIRLNLLKL